MKICTKTSNFQNRIYQRNWLKTTFNDSMDSMEEECGVFGIYSPNNIDTFSLAQFGMFALQHRGQEAAGVSVLKEGNIKTYKSTGLVLDVFKQIEEIEEFQGNAAIGHTRYTTAGGGSSKNIQPLYAVNYYGKPHFSIAHNGNVIETDELKEELYKEGLPFLATSDTEVILRSIQKHSDLSVQEAIQKGLKNIRGAYSVLLLTKNSLAAFRDPNGIRPLCIGKIDEETYVFSSESCALDAVGAEFIRDVEPGEIIVADKDGLHSYSLEQPSKQRICAFEYIYFARPDSNIQGKDIYDLRVESGRKLYEQSPVEADVVIGVPDSGVPSAIGFSNASGIPFEPILVKNRYMSRSFIVPSQEMRERVVNLKLNPIKDKIKGKRLVILDDSIVRGTTSKLLIKILKEAGAKEIHFRSASPPIIAPCFLGIDMPTKKDLISANMNNKELAVYLGVDSLDFLSVPNLIEIIGSTNHCFGCFTEKYPVQRNASKDEFYQKKIEY
ncbi:amidophosphoribosyltransferase [Moheibacter lacus]|uniref:Amidophosphoribosyltransferase n=1 Tax=Moheibacter lacus TaxID=2745851 RepID=A0A838ZL50_9FLAO|nr:amidophosphoribosyltransferase [Moheibacter lacus]MBA5628226.1 amidophosphoribosyltransferase [Moheibacter lacus]